MADTRLTIKVEAGTALANAAQNLLQAYTEWLVSVGYLDRRSDADQVIAHFMEASNGEDPAHRD